jgi:hypothetical protein
VEQKFSQIEFVYRNRDGQEDPKGKGKKVMWTTFKEWQPIVNFPLRALLEYLIGGSSYPCLLGREKKIETTRTPCVEQKFSQIEFVYRNRDGQEDPKGEGKKVMWTTFKEWQHIVNFPNYIPVFCFKHGSEFWPTVRKKNANLRPKANYL